MQGNLDGGGVFAAGDARGSARCVVSALMQRRTKVPAHRADRSRTLCRATAQARAPRRFCVWRPDPADRYEKIVSEWMGSYCYRRVTDGAYDWPHDATARDTGPFMTQFVGGQFTSKGLNTHAVARVWYSPNMLEWMAVNRPAEEDEAPANPPPIPDGAILVKEMWPAPAALYVGKCFDCMPPGSSGAVIFIRDSKTFSTGWFCQSQDLRQPRRFRAHVSAHAPCCDRERPTTGRSTVSAGAGLTRIRSADAAAARLSRTG